MKLKKNAPRAIVWGVERTLLDLPARITDRAIPEQTIASLAEELGPEAAIDKQWVRGAVRRAFAAGGMPCGDVAWRYGVDEGILTSGMYNLVARNEVWVKASQFPMPDQHVLNLFELSQKAGIAQFAVADGSGEWGRVCTNAVGLFRFMRGVAGSEFNRQVHGAMATRHEAGIKVIDALVGNQWPRARVLVVDHDAAYVAAARARGYRAIQITKDYGIPEIYRDVLGLSASTRRSDDGHIYSGVTLSRKGASASVPKAA